MTEDSKPVVKTESKDVKPVIKEEPSKPKPSGKLDFFGKAKPVPKPTAEMPKIKIEPEESSIAPKAAPKPELKPPRSNDKAGFWCFLLRFVDDFDEHWFFSPPLRGSPPLSFRILTMRARENVQGRRHLHVPSPKARRASRGALSSRTTKTRSRNRQRHPRDPKPRTKQKRELPPQIPMQTKTYER